jgi:GH15 family glucan-1,4-alpha-glucosidase
VGNGVVLVNFDEQYYLRDIYFPHVGKENHTVGHLCRFGIFIDGQFSWVGDDWERELKYIPETLVTDVTLTNNRLGIKLVIHDAVDFYLWVFLKEVIVYDLSGRDRQVKLFFAYDFHISGNDVGDTAFYDPRTNSMIHYKDERWFLINVACDNQYGLEQWAAGTKEAKGLVGTWKDAEDGQLSGNSIAQGSVDSVIGISSLLKANGEQKFYQWLCFGLAYEKVVKLNDIVKQKTPHKLIERTKKYWHLWVNKETHNFSGFSKNIESLYKRSLLILRSQIDDNGAIIAANDFDIAQYGKDTYSYMWPRDGALTAYALSKAGYIEVSQKFFQFCLGLIKEDGYFLHKYNPDGTVASSWHPWYQNGKVDLPIQEDETALVLWSLWQHFNIFHDIEFLKPLYRRLIVNAADFLVSYRDDNSLPLPSYDLWEERRGIHIFTVASVIAGLNAAASFANAFGEYEQRDYWLSIANKMREAMIEHMWSEKDKRFCRMLTVENGKYIKDMTVDSSAYGIFAFGALPANDERVKATMQAIYDNLWVKSQVGGVARYQEDYYHKISSDTLNIPGNPWFICTMWLAQYKIAKANNLSELAEAIPILEWVSNHALKSGVLAEQVNPYTNEPLSVSPLTWSHATFVTCVLEYLEKQDLLCKKETDNK